MEMFVHHGGLVFNEIAPRPHNSFHWTIEGCRPSQFTQLIRILARKRVGYIQMRGTRFVMENILGEDMEGLDSLRKDRTKSVHLYGKTEARKGRKMGHVTWHEHEEGER